jgi:zinc-ribbon domain
MAAEAIPHELPLVALLVVLVVSGFVWELGDLVLETFNRIRKRRHHRPCPRCGRPVRVDARKCSECGFDLPTVPED